MIYDCTAVSAIFIISNLFKVLTSKQILAKLCKMLGLILENV